jgi:hypothetical protein
MKPLSKTPRFARVLPGFLAAIVAAGCPAPCGVVVPPRPETPGQSDGDDGDDVKDVDDGDGEGEGTHTAEGEGEVSSEGEGEGGQPSTRGPRFVAVGYGGRRLWSREGVTWQGDVEDVAHGGDDDRLLRGACVGADTDGAQVLLAVGGSSQGRVLRSTDGGDTWTSYSDDRGYLGACAFGVVSGVGVFVVVGSARSDRSVDGGRTLVDHATHYDQGSWHMRDVIFVPGLGSDSTAFFLAVGDRGITTSVDGVHWTTPVGPTGLFRVALGHGRLVAVGHNAWATSADGTTWTTDVASAPSGGNDVAFADGRFMVVGSGFRSSSVDGLSWTRSEQPSLDHLVAGTVDGVVVWLGTRWPDVRLRSTDAETWTQVARDDGNALEDLVFLP